ncbi:MAG TPA: hypothetical protein DHW42_09440 [Candidatus Marinimicrobia bacterium]|nr:hypothetical protein [Candidatus Neomarinimicrobiota bacterium]
MKVKSFFLVFFIIFAFVVFLMIPGFAQEEVLPEEEMMEELIIIEVEEEIAEEAAVEEIIEKTVGIIEESCIPERKAVIGVSYGGMIPFGQNIKNNYETGTPFGIHTMITGLAKFGCVTLDVGLESGYYTAKNSTGSNDLNGVPVYALLDFNLSNLFGFYLCTEVAAGFNMQTADKSYRVFGVTPGLVCGFNVIKGLDFILKIRGAEIFTGYEGGDGTQDWIDLRAGINYTL